MTAEEVDPRAYSAPQGTSPQPQPQPLPPPLPSSRRSSAAATSPKESLVPSTTTGHVPAMKRTLPPPLGPRSPMSPGTSRRTSYTIPASVPTAPRALPDPKYQVSVEPARAHDAPAAPPAEEPKEDATEIQENNAKLTNADVESLLDTSYRSPEAVVEYVEDSWNSHLPPGVLAEHLEDDGWGKKQRANTPNDMMEVDRDVLPDYTPERPQIGPGMMVRRWLDKIHPHTLYRPMVTGLPKQSASKTPPVRSMSISSDGAPVEAPSEYPVLTIDDVISALPGGKEHHDEWYFCPDCWGWYHVVKSDILNPTIPTMPEWLDAVSFDTEEELNNARDARYQALCRYEDLTSGRGMAVQRDTHFHPFHGLVPSAAGPRIERVQVEGHVDKFVHLEVGESPERYEKYAEPTEPATLWVSCSSDHWVFIDKGPFPGQLPRALVSEFTNEKHGNPGPGQTPTESAINAWQLVLTLLQNPVFRGQRGWVKMSNPTFQNKIGASLISSHLLYQMGFACNEEEGEGYRVGPFTKNERITDDDVRQMDRYMARTWVEVSIALQAFQVARNVPVTATEFVVGKHLHTELEQWLAASKIPTLSLGFEVKPFQQALETLGVTHTDVVETVSSAYDLQISDDHKHLASYLGALEKLSRAQVAGSEILQIKVATERSLDRYSQDDVEAAYCRIGIDDDYVKGVLIDDRNDIHEEWVLDMHRRAMENASDATARAAISQALGVIGKERNSNTLMQIARNGGVYLSLNQAYQEFNITRDSNIDDDLLIMQYETFISDRPSRADHYRMALSIIADAPGEERPVLQAFLQGKDVSEFQPPVRRDIPAGLRNIGNTCYLNSVLQFLYTIKPIRDAVMAFEEGTPGVPSEEEMEKEMERRVKIQSSRRFVGLLRELFGQMYTTSARAVVPTEELARLAILPVDLVGERKDAILYPTPKSRVTIDSLPVVLSPDSSTISSGGATAADSPTTSPPTTPLIRSPPMSARRRDSILGKRASHDRESAFGGSEERLRRLTDSSERDLIEFGSGPSSPAPVNSESDVDMENQLNPATREGSELPNTSLSKLGITSPLTEVGPTDVGPSGDASATQPPESTPAPVQPPMGPPPLPPRRRHSTALVAAEKFGLQQDAAEILINVLAQLEYALETPSDTDTPEPNLISTLFSSKFRQQMLLQSADGSIAESHAPVESVFVHPIIGVEEDGKDLYDCLAELYLGGAEIEYEGKKGFKMDLIDQLPPMLYIQMRRSQYDYVKRRQTKTNTHIPFDRTLTMDRFLVGADSAKRERSIALTREMMRMRARRHELKNHKPMSIPDTFRYVRDALAADSTVNALDLSRESSGDLVSMADSLPRDILDALDTEAKAAETEISDLETKLPIAKKELEELWSGEDEVEYELVSVFVHGGTGTGGHYWTYQANLPIDGNKFFYYSDETVKEVPSEEVFADKSAKGVSPALLCYVRKDRNIVDTLHREAEPDSGETTEAGASGSTSSSEAQPFLPPARFVALA